MKRPLSDPKEMMRRAKKVRRTGTVTVQVDVPVEVYDALLKRGPNVVERINEALRRAAGLRKRK
jgi:uncharacterized protein (DUF4415 family)